MKAYRRPHYRNIEAQSSVFAIAMLTAKSMVVSIVLCSLFMFVMFHVKSATAADLRTLAVVKSDILRLGDIFENAGAKADKVIGRTPMPGEEMRINARTLMRIARAANLDWQAQSVLDEVVIRRDATVASKDMVESSIKEALLEKGIARDTDIEIHENLARFILPEGEPQTIELDDFRLNPSTNSFQASLFAPSVDRPLKSYTVTGFVHETVEIPVLMSFVKEGDIISASDVKTLRLREDALPRGTLMHVSDLQGMAAAKSLKPNDPIRNIDIALPQLVERGSELTLIFDNEIMRLTAKGKALQNGARGEFVRVVNTESNKNLNGLVTGLNEVTIR